MSENKAISSIKEDFSLFGILQIPIAIAINTVGAQIVTALKLPIFLDSIGTIFAAVIAGPWVGAVTGLLSNLVNGVFDPSFIPYSIVSIAIGLATGILARKKFFTKPWKVAIAGIVIGLVCTVFGVPITTYLYGGVTGSGNTFITAYLLATGSNLLTSVTTSVLLSNLVDKVLTAFIVFAIVGLIPARQLSQFSQGSLYVDLFKKKSHTADSTAAVVTESE